MEGASGNREALESRQSQMRETCHSGQPHGPAHCHHLGRCSPQESQSSVETSTGQTWLPWVPLGQPSEPPKWDSKRGCVWWSTVIRWPYLTKTELYCPPKTSPCHLPPRLSIVENSLALIVVFSSLENGVRELAYLVETEVANSLNFTVASVLVNKLDNMVKLASLARVKQASKQQRC